MKKAQLIILLLFILIYNSNGQSIYLEKKEFALDFGIGYSHNYFDENEYDFNHLIYNVSGSILSIIDIGFQYSSIIGKGKNKSPSSYTIDVHLSKDPIGVAVNTAYQKRNILIGISLYKIFKVINTTYADKIIPIFSVGALLPEQLVYGFGLTFQKDLNKNIKIAFTPGINENEYVTQLYFGFELIIH